MDHGMTHGPWYESWSCNMKYYTDLTDKTKADTIEMIYYEGDKRLSFQRGTYITSNTAQQVPNSVWYSDPQLSTISQSKANSSDQNYMMF